MSGSDDPQKCEKHILKTLAADDKQKFEIITK
jgi:hypothetical protein